MGNWGFLSHNQRNSVISQKHCDCGCHLCAMRQTRQTPCLLLVMLSVCQHMPPSAPYIILCILAQMQLFRKSVEKLCDWRAEMWYNPNNSWATAQSSYHNLFMHLILPLNPSCSLRLVILRGWRSGCIQNGRFFPDSMSNMREIPCLQQVF